MLFIFLFVVLGSSAAFGLKIPVSILEAGDGNEPSIKYFEVSRGDNIEVEADKFCGANQISPVDCYIIKNKAAEDLWFRPKLTLFGRNIYSLDGEDGMIALILDRIGVGNKKSIEFGAHDGLTSSNTANLFVNHGWESILIENDRFLYEKMVENVKPYKCTCLNEKIGIESQSIESILAKYNVSSHGVDLLSIDIDGNDYYVFKSLEIMKPRIIIVEYNPTYPAHLEIYFPYHEAHGFGASVTALVQVAHSKGYTLIGINSLNLFFVRVEDKYKFADIDTSLASMRQDHMLRYVISDYSGRQAVVVSSKYTQNIRLIDHVIEEEMYGDAFRFQ